MVDVGTLPAAGAVECNQAATRAKWLGRTSPGRWVTRDRSGHFRFRTADPLITAGGSRVRDIAVRRWPAGVTAGAMDLVNSPAMRGTTSGPARRTIAATTA